MKAFSILLLHFLLFLLISITLSAHGCHEEERKALLNFKSSLDDPSGRLSTWQESVQHRNCCDWHGIKCSDESRHVVSVDLRNTKLEDYIYGISRNDDLYSTRSNSVLGGKLSPYLFNITHLEYLDLGFNDFQKSDITHQFSNLTKLTHLDLSSSNFSASVSKQFSNLTLLQYLDLSCFMLDIYTSCLESPSTKWVRGLVNLRVLRLSGIDLFKATSSSQENFSQHISYLSNLRHLDISNCNIHGPVFPIHQFHNLSHLSSLRMKSNHVLNSSIPLQLANLTSLSVLDMSSCNFLHGSIPYLPQVKELDVSDTNLDPGQLTRMFELPWPKLQTLDISGIQLTESIPSTISKAPNLVSLSASKCSIQGSLPSSIYNHLSRLQYLDLSSNYMITDSIHSSISNLKDLKSLDLSYNNIHGPISESICNMCRLRHLDLRNNKITGTIPSCITKLRNLSVFDVSRNSIGGKVSLLTFVNELDLTHLDLSSNNLTVVINQHLLPSKLEDLRLGYCNIQGYIPASICNFTHLERVYLSFNNLTGAIPPCIYKLKKLFIFDLSNNKLGGPLPLLPTGVYFLDLSNNKLDGEISIEIGESLSRVSRYNLKNNELSGSIPSSLCSQKLGMSYTSDINLSSNKLSGIIPTSIGNCRGLHYLNLGNNSLTGNVPKGLEHTILECLQLNDNNLNGPFPIFIPELFYLRVLNLGNNNFEGILPTGLGLLYGLQILSLRSNRFNGSIPEDIIHFPQLQILDLSSNNFSGQIPSKLGYLTALTRKIYGGVVYGENVEYQLAIKGTTIQIEDDERVHSGIDLSCNILGGNIPEEIGLLQGLGVLNLSHNHLSSNIPANIGNMSS